MNSETCHDYLKLFFFNEDIGILYIGPLNFKSK